MLRLNAPPPLSLGGDLRPMSGFHLILVITDFSPHVPSVSLSSPRAARAIAPCAATSRLERYGSKSSTLAADFGNPPGVSPALWLLAPVSCSVYHRFGRVAGHVGRYYAHFTACCHGCGASTILVASMAVCFHPLPSRSGRSPIVF